MYITKYTAEFTVRERNLKTEKMEVENRLFMSNHKYHNINPSPKLLNPNKGALMVVKIMTAL